MTTKEALGATRASLSQRLTQSATLTKLYWLLRIGVGVEYLGHGWAGLSRSRAWLPYYDLFGISADTAVGWLMYVTGAVDIYALAYRPGQARSAPKARN